MKIFFPRVSDRKPHLSYLREETESGAQEGFIY